MYTYITENNLESPQSYMYTKYKGREFLKEYFDSRRRYAELFLVGSVNAGIRDNDKKIFQYLDGMLAKGIGDKEKLARIFIHKFEVSKILHRAYDESMKPIREKGYAGLEAYIYLCYAAVECFDMDKNMKYLNAALKLNDLICSCENFIKGDEMRRLAAHCIERETGNIKTKLEAEGITI